MSINGLKVQVFTNIDSVFVCMKSCQNFYYEITNAVTRLQVILFVFTCTEFCSYATFTASGLCD